MRAEKSGGGGAWARVLGIPAAQEPKDVVYLPEVSAT